MSRFSRIGDSLAYVWDKKAQWVPSLFHAMLPVDSKCSGNTCNPVNCALNAWRHACQAETATEADIVRIFGILGKEDTKESDTLMKMFYPNPKTRISVYSKWRSPVKTIPSLLQVAKHAGYINKEYCVEIIEEAKVLRRQKVAVKVTVNVELVIDRVKRFASMSNWRYKMVAVLVAYGGRTADVFRNTVIEHPNKTGWITVGNIAKKKDDQKDATVDRPLLGLDWNEFKSALDEVRASNPKPFQDCGKLKTIFGKHLGSICKELHEGVVRPHDLRALYACITFKKFAETEGCSDQILWCQRVLGHVLLETSTSYSVYDAANGVIEEKKTDTAEPEKTAVSTKRCREYKYNECERMRKREKVREAYSSLMDKKIRPSVRSISALAPGIGWDFISKCIKNEKAAQRDPKPPEDHHEVGMSSTSQTSEKL